VNDFGLYLVMTDPKVGYAACAEAAVRANVRIVQLRMKDAGRDEYVRTAREVRAVTRGTDTIFIVNDDPVVAVEAEADGVHVGQDDLPVSEVRRRYPSLGLVGLSTHSPEQALASLQEKPDYIGVGPVWPTPTKAVADPALGLDILSRMIASVPYPAVAIGGIDETNLPSVLAAGARNFAVVRAVCASVDPYSALRRLQEAALRS
jgi:thiamine-phosphate pyrophosphorylase